MIQEAFYRGTVKAPRFSLHECKLLMLSIIYIYIYITNKMHFNIYDIFYSLHSHQYVVAAIAADTCW